MSKEGLQCVITQEAVSIQLDKNNSRDVSHQDFLDIYTKTMGKTKVELTETTLLPSNVVTFSQGPGVIQLTCYFPSAVRRLLYIGGRESSKPQEMQILTPNMIISHQLKQESTTKDWLVAGNGPKYYCTDVSASRLPKKWISERNNNERIWISPFSNTYGEGNMCTGGNSMPKRFPGNNLRGLDWYYGFLWESPFNNDLGLYALGGSMHPSEWYALLAKCAKDNLPFPYDKLSGYTKPV